MFDRIGTGSSQGVLSLSRLSKSHSPFTHSHSRNMHFSRSQSSLAFRFGRTAVAAIFVALRSLRSDSLALHCHLHIAAAVFTVQTCVRRRTFELDVGNMHCARVRFRRRDLVIAQLVFAAVCPEHQALRAAVPFRAWRCAFAAEWRSRVSIAGWV